MRESFDAKTRRPFLAALAAVFLGALDLTVIATVLPKMIVDLRINTADIDRYVWVVNAYLLAYVVAIPVVGRLSDMLGRTPIVLGSLAVFTIGSLLCANAETLESLIAARTIQGLGGGALLPVTIALVGDLFPPGRRIAAIGIVGAVDTIGWVLGPIWGAVVTGLPVNASEPWRLIFWLNIPIAILAGFLIWRAGDRHLMATRHAPLRNFDLIGSLFFAGALLCFNLALSSGGEVGVVAGSGLRAFGGSKNPLANYLWPLLAAAFVLGSAFVLWSRRRKTPLFARELFQSPVILAVITINFLVGAALIVAMVDGPVAVALTSSGGDVSRKSAFILAPFTLGMAIFSFAGGRIASSLGELRTAAVGVAMVVAGYGLLWKLATSDNIYTMVPGLMIAGIGFGLVMAPLGAILLDAAPSSELGSASALSMVARLLGMTIGISALTAVGVRRLQVLTGRLEPVVQKAGESTAEYLVRQAQYIQDTAIPLSFRVIKETFLLAAMLAALAFIPLLYLSKRAQANAERSSATASATDAESL
jgi:MFS family permease